MNLFVAGTDFACIFVILIIFISTLLLNKQEKRYSYFMISAGSLLLVCTSDCIAFVMDELGGNDTLHFYCNLFSYAGVDIVLAAFVYYISDKLKETISFSKIHESFVLALCAADMLLMVWGSYSGNLFRIENQKTVIGPLGAYVGVFQFIVSAYFLSRMFTYRKLLDKKLLYTISFYFMLPVLSVLIEMIYPNMNVTYIISTLIILIVYIAVVREDLRASEISEKILKNVSLTDNLTGLLNRRAYEEDITNLTETYPKEFVFLSLDVNGLKNVNDTIGHAAGDEMIRGAAQCIQRCLGPYGKVYRTGGDEFLAILFIPKVQFGSLMEYFEKETAEWRGDIVDSLSISYGYVSAEEAQGMSIHDISVLADKRMYAAKALYYRVEGIDRRGQIDAHVALYKLYTKILRINITSNSYKIINMNEEEQTEEKGFSAHISNWLKGFGESGQVHEDDLEMYLQKTDISYLREYFKQGKKMYSIQYRRNYSDGYKTVIMDMIPTGNYSNDNQELFLYVKSID